MECKDSEKLEGEGEGKDIISRMPEDVLVRIISNLETIEAVRTCILSSKWKNLWKLVDKLYFDFPTVYYAKCAPSVNQVLAHLQSENIQSFYLYVRFDPFKDYFIDDERNGYIEDYIPEWAAYAAEHNVRELILDADTYYITLPQCILTCASLVKLELRSGFFSFDVPQSLVCFPSLISMYFYIFGDHARDFSQLRNLFHGCPVLEDLTIRTKMVEVDSVTFELMLPSLKTLSIKEEKAFLVGYGAPDKFAVEARNLEYLTIYGSETFPLLVLGDAPYLQKVTLRAIIRNVEEYISTIQGNKIMELLTGIRYTRSLVIIGDIVIVLNLAFDGNMPTFRNLINLELVIESYDSIKLLRHFLTNSPNLQTLTLELGRVIYGVHQSAELRAQSDFVWFDLRTLPPSLLSSIKRIQMRNPKENAGLEAIKYLLQHGKALESFSVRLNYTKPDVAEYQRNCILGFPKPSTLTEVEFPS